MAILSFSITALADTDFLCLSSGEERTDPVQGFLKIRIKGESRIDKLSDPTPELLASEIYKLTSNTNQEVMVMFYSGVSEGASRTFPHKLGEWRDQFSNKIRNYSLHVYKSNEKNWDSKAQEDYSLSLSPREQSGGWARPMSIDSKDNNGKRVQLIFDKCLVITKNFYDPFLSRALRGEMNWKCGLESVKDSNFFNDIKDCRQQNNGLLKFACEIKNNLAYKDDYYHFSDDVAISKSDLESCADFYNKPRLEVELNPRGC